MSAQGASNDVDSLLNEFDDSEDIDEMIEEVDEDRYMSEPYVSS